ncbi:MAG TPA: hypothetical protein DCP25_08170 [Chloroflexi bacterium]|nr:hypothetical protein [Chloroflexota bacterium]
MVELIHQPLHDALGLVTRCVGHDDRELVTPVAGRDVLHPHAPADDPTERAQHCVAGKVPVRVIDPLQAVDVEVRHRERCRAALGTRDLLLEAAVEVAVVVNAGERVRVGRPLQSLVQLGNVDGRGDLRGDRLQEREVPPAEDADRRM